jgi:hypothetical protein
LQSQNATVPVEIKIESGDDDDDDDGGGGNIAEPLVALSSTVNLEDQDVSKGKILLYCGVAVLKVWDGINLFNARVV